MSMADRDGVIWLDGELVPWRDAKIHVLTHTLHYGMGAFEGVRAYETDRGPAIFRLKEHTDRLFNSANILSMKMPFSKQEINDAQTTVIRAFLTQAKHALEDIDLIDSDLDQIYTKIDQMVADVENYEKKVGTRNG